MLLLRAGDRDTRVELLYAGGGHGGLKDTDSALQEEKT